MRRMIVLVFVGSSVGLVVPLFSVAFFNGHFLDFYAGVFRAHGVARRDGHQHVHAFDDLPKDAMFAVQPGRGDMRDEEL